MGARPSPARSSRAIIVAAALPLAGVGAWALRSFDPGAAGSPFPPCLFHFATGLYCPGCGITRALHALAHGDAAGAWAMNPLLVLALPVLAAMAWLWLSDRPKLPLRVLYDGRAWIALLLAFGVLRNLPWPPFAWLAPG